MDRYLIQVGKRPNDLEFIQDIGQMRGIEKFFTYLLPCPMLVVTAIGPQSAGGQVVDDPFESDPNFFTILSVSQTELSLCVCFHYCEVMWL